jgi:hypothetical protein
MINKKAGIGKLFGWLIFILAVVLIILLVRNNMDFEATVQQILGFFGQSKTQ